MEKEAAYKIITYCIATVWIINGFFCKVLHLVPRHEQIVSRILADNHAGSLTLFIGLAETGMAIWILTGIKAKLNAIIQIIIVITMNILEFILAPDLLLWGKLNAFFAFLFASVVFCNEFYLNKRPAS